MNKLKELCEIESPTEADIMAIIEELKAILEEVEQCGQQ